MSRCCTWLCNLEHQLVYDGESNFRTFSWTRRRDILFRFLCYVIIREKCKPCWYKNDFWWSEFRWGCGLANDTEETPCFFLQCNSLKLFAQNLYHTSLRLVATHCRQDTIPKSRKNQVESHCTKNTTMPATPPASNAPSSGPVSPAQPSSEKSRFCDHSKMNLSMSEALVQIEIRKSCHCRTSIDTYPGY